MDIVIDVVDSLSAQPLQGATISVNGTAVGMTNANGIYPLSCDESDLITVSYVGYSDYAINAGVIEGSAQVQMSKAGAILPTVTVTPSNKKNSALPWILGGGALLLLADNGKKSVGKIDKKTGMIIGIGALGLAAVYFITKKPATQSPPIASGQYPTQYLPTTSPGGSSSNLLSSGSGFLSSLTNLFRGTSTPAPGSAAAWVPVGIADTSYNASSPGVTAPDVIDPGSSLNLDFSGAPGMSGIGAIPTYLPIAALGALALFSSGKKKVGDASSYIIPIGVVVGGYLILKNLNLFGGGANSSNNDSITDSTNAGINQSISDLTAAGAISTMSDAQAAGIAGTIYNAGIADPVDSFTIRQQLIQANTTLDLLKIAKAFGTKQAAPDKLSTCYLFGFGCQAYNLQSFCRAAMTNDDLNTVNNYMSSQGINYSF